jgi:hypothetical protein
MTVALATFFPNEKQTLVLKFVEHLLQTFERKTTANRRNASPNYAQIRHLETAGAIRKTVKPSVFCLRPFGARRKFVRSPHRVKIDYAFRHNGLPNIPKSPSPAFDRQTLTISS